MNLLASSIRGRLMAAVLLVGGLGLWSACDTVPAPERDQQAPSVSGLQVTPDRFHESDSTVQVPDSGSTAQVNLGILAQANDTDGTVERVMFLIEPSSNPRGTFSGRLPPAPAVDNVYGGVFDSLSVPLVDEVYTVRVFAVDDDSLTSNQVTGQFRFVPSDTSATARPAAVNRSPDGR